MLLRYGNPQKILYYYNYSLLYNTYNDLRQFRIDISKK